MEKENNDNLIIDNKYKIIDELGGGGFGKVYLVMKDNLEYAIKISKHSDNEMLNNEIKMLNLITDYIKDKAKEDKEYIIKMIEHGEDTCNPKIKRYIVLEYAPKGTLFKYINDPNHIFSKGGLGEIFGKIIFKKILKGVETIHSAGICHLDLKLENILLDENFNPKIADFGLANLINNNNFGKVKLSKGTLGYASLERVYNRPFNGIKADIFSLGVILLYLVTGKSTFQDPYKRINDKAYLTIVQKKYPLFWETIGIQFGEVSEEFKDLFIKMVHFTPSKRPSINEILKDPWMKKDSNEKRMEDYEKEIYKEFQRRELLDKVNKLKNNVINAGKNEEDNFQLRSSDYEHHLFFENNFYLEYIDDKKIKIEDYLRIEGDLNPLKFMNSIANKIQREFENSYIEASEKYFKFDIGFENEEDEKENIPENLENELKELGIENIDDYNNYITKKDLNIQLKLFKSVNDYYIIRFFKTSGEIKEYYKILNVIISLIKKIL